MNFSQLPVARRLGVVFSAIVLLFIVVAGTSYWAARSLAETDRWNSHTYKVLALSQELLADMVDMETGARGYLLVGDDEYLAPWKDGKQRFDKHWQALKDLTADNAAQQQRLDQMQQHREEFVAVIQPLLDQRKGLGMGSIEMTVLFAEFAQGRDKLAMDDFRKVDQAFSGAEGALLVESRADAEATRAMLYAVLLLGTLLAVTPRPAWAGC